MDPAPIWETMARLLSPSAPAMAAARRGAVDPETMRIDLAFYDPDAALQFRPIHRIYSAEPREGERRRFEGWEGDPAALRDAPLVAGGALRIPIRCRYEALTEVRVMFGTYVRENACRVEMRLFETTAGRTTLLRFLSHDGRQIENNRFHAFVFEPVRGARGREFLVELTSPDATLDSCLGVIGNILPKADSVGAPPALRGSFHPPQALLPSIPTPGSSSVFVPIAVLRYEPVLGAIPIFGWEGRALQLYVAPLRAGDKVRLPFVASGEKLTALSLFCSTYARRNDCRLVFDLYEEGAKRRLAGTRSISALDIKDNVQNNFDLGGLPVPKGARLTLEIYSENATDDNHIAIWGNVLPRGSNMLESKGREGSEALVDFEETVLDVERFLASERVTRSRPLPARISDTSIALFVPEQALFEEREALRTLLDMLEALGVAPEIFGSAGYSKLLAELPSVDVLCAVDCEWDEEATQLARFARHASIPFVAFSSPVNVPLVFGREARFSLPRVEERTAKRVLAEASRLRKSAAAADLVVTRSEAFARYLSELGRPHLVWPERAEALGEALLDLVRSSHERSLPTISLVSVLYAKEREVERFLESVLRQRYAGEYEIILVDDCSPDRSSELAEAYLTRRKREAGEGRFPAWRIVKNERNLGNCGSRNRGIELAKGEILVVIDADCVLSSNLFESHARAYVEDAADAVIGYCNLETLDRDPMRCLEAYEADPDTVAEEACLQDPSNRESFVNCVTRNFSVRRSLGAKEPLFDDLFAYSKSPESGYGWEDVEMGYRLYARGARIRFAPKCFTMHISHESVSDERGKPARSMLNLERLVSKHPEVVSSARRWLLDTFDKICAWSDGLGLPKTPERLRLEQRLRPYSSLLLETSRRKPRVLTYRWHCAHQYELYKLGYDFTLVRFPWDTFVNGWSYRERPMPFNARMLALEDVREEDYDLAILHFDENVLAPYNCNGVIGSDWGTAFRWFRENLKLPSVAICHGTPQFRGQYDPKYRGDDRGMVLEDERRRLVDYVGDMLVITNSHQARREWGFDKSRVIWHGFDPSELPATTYEKGILTLGKGMRDRPIYRGLALYEEVERLLGPAAEIYSPDFLEPHPYHRAGTNGYAERMFHAYRDNLRRYSIYFNPTLRSPMPRSRGEAMMCGLVSVSALNHDVELFVKHGWNGFYSDDPAELAECMRYLLSNPAACREMGRRSRQLAMDLFNHDRYLAEWRRVISDLCPEAQRCAA